MPRLTSRLSLERMPSVFLAAVGRPRQCRVTCPERSAEISERVHDLLAGGMLGQRRGALAATGFCPHWRAC